MRNRLVLALLLLFVSCLPCVAQTTTVVDVKDESTVKCDVRMSGTIELTESEVQGEDHTSFASQVSATNLSNVPIIAIVTFTTIGNALGPLVGENRGLDAFFDHNKEIAPGQTWTKKFDDNGGVFITTIPKGGDRVPPAASGQVIFVQFADGSSCGDPNDERVTSLMDARADLFLALKRIDDAAKIGESKFLNALADKATDRTGNVEGILGNIRDMQQEKGSTAAIECIRRMLDVAASR